MAGWSSTLSLPTFSLPAYCVAISSTDGATRRHGPHQGAQKSISTGVVACNTSVSKLLVVMVRGSAIVDSSRRSIRTVTINARCRERQSAALYVSEYPMWGCGINSPAARAPLKENWRCSGLRRSVPRYATQYWHDRQCTYARARLPRLYWSDSPPYGLPRRWQAGHSACQSSP